MQTGESFDCRVLSGEGLWGGRIFEFKSLPSTNGWAMSHLQQCRHGDGVWARHQTRGRGRMDRRWVTPAGKALTLSFILTRFPHQTMIHGLGQLAALAVSRTLTELRLETLLKWPNDVLVGNRKIAGILSEADTRQGAVVLGIGINISMRPSDFQAIAPDFEATSVLMETGQEFDADRLRQWLTQHIMELWEENAGSMNSLISQWSHQDWLKESRIEIQTPSGLFSGDYQGLDELGRLCLKDERGEQLRFWSGDVGKVRPRQPGNRL